MQVKKQHLEPDMKQWTGSKLGKELVKAVCCHPAYLTYMQSTSCEMPGWMKQKLESRFLGEMWTNSGMLMKPPLWQKARTKEPLVESEEESEKVGVTLNIQKIKIMASRPISSLQFSHSVESNSLWPHGRQHGRLPCSSPTPRVYYNSCLLSQWCHTTISCSVIPFSSHLQYFPASGYFQTNQFFTSGGQSIGVSV